MDRRKDKRTGKVSKRPTGLVNKSIQRLQDEIVVLKSQGKTKYVKLLENIIRRLQKM